MFLFPCLAVAEALLIRSLSSVEYGCSSLSSLFVNGSSRAMQVGLGILQEEELLVDSRSRSRRGGRREME